MAIREDADHNEDTGLTRSEAVDAFLDKWQPDAEKPSKPVKGAKEPDEDEETPSDDSDDDAEEIIHEDDDSEDDEDQSDDDEDSETIAGDNAKVEITIDGKKQTVSVKDLKRLYGQEGALTRKSQEVAEKRKEAEAGVARNKAALDKMFERAQKRYEPYAKIDFLLASKQLDDDEFNALRTAALSAYEDVKFYAEELDAAEKAVNDKRIEDHKVAAKAAIEFLENPETGIKGWGQDLYLNIGNWARSQGMTTEDFAQITNPRIIKMMWQAMRYDAAKKVTLKKTAETPKKVIKSKKSNNPGQKFTRGAAAENALKKLKSSGSRQDAADAFLARWSDGSDD